MTQGGPRQPLISGSESRARRGRSPPPSPGHIMLPPHLLVPHRGPSEPGESPAGTPGVRPAAGSAPGGARLNVSDRGGWPFYEGPGAGRDRAPGAVCEGLRRVTAAGSLGWARGWVKTASRSSAASFGALSPHSRGIRKQGWHLKLLLAAAL